MWNLLVVIIAVSGNVAMHETQMSSEEACKIAAEQITKGIGTGKIEVKTVCFAAPSGLGGSGYYAPQPKSDKPAGRF